MVVPEPLKVLAVGHDAGRQGAPILFREILEWSQRAAGLELRIVLHRGGPLLPLFEELAPTTVLNPYLGSPQFRSRLIRQFFTGSSVEWLRSLWLRRRLRLGAFDVIWANSVAAWPALQALGSTRVPRVLHVHELEYVIRRVGPPAGQLASLADRFIAASAAVRDNLVERHGVAAKLISVIHSSVPSSLRSGYLPEDVGEARRALAIGDNDVVLVGCGVGELRKGVDLLPKILKQLESAGLPAVKLLWIGRIDDDLRELLTLEASRCATKAQLRFLGEIDDPLKVFAAGDIFILTSREEPLGMVCLEAAQCGLPTVCFADAGGAPEFVGDDAGRAVPYLDVAAFAEAVMQLVQNPALRRRLGERARSKVDEGFTVEVAAPKILEVLRHAVVEQEL